MSENFNSHIACEGTDNDINWVCKVCKDLPNYAGMYLYQREREKNQLKNVKDIVKRKEPFPRLEKRFGFFLY